MRKKMLTVLSGTAVCFEIVFLTICSFAEMAADACRDFADLCDEKVNQIR